MMFWLLFSIINSTFAKEYYYDYGMGNTVQVTEIPAFLVMLLYTYNYDSPCVDLYYND